jgi:hypothetical protein
MFFINNKIAAPSKWPLRFPLAKSVMHKNYFIMYKYTGAECQVNRGIYTAKLFRFGASFRDLTVERSSETLVVARLGNTMEYRGKVEFAAARKLRERNTALYRLAHWPIWIWVFFLAPGPLTFSLFAHGFGRGNLLWLIAVLVGTGIAAVRGKLPGSEPRPYILRFDEDKPNPLYRRVCYTFAWSAVLTFALLNLEGLAVAALTGGWYIQQIYSYGYAPLCALVLLMGLAGFLPRVGSSTKGEGTERRYFYGSVWSVVMAQTVLLILWKTLPISPATSWVKLVIYVAVLVAMGVAASRGLLLRTRPILPGESMVAD